MIRTYRRIIIISVILSIILFSGLYTYYYARWEHQWAIQSSLPFYAINTQKDSLLRVVMIGDSWTGMHQEYGMDSFLKSELGKRISCPIVVSSKGKGGETCKGIYQLIFQNEGYGTKSLFLSGADYCIISAGINDAAKNLGTKQFCAYYRMIINFLLAKGIRPVIIEIPNVDIWNIYKRKPLKNLLTDFIKSTMTRCKMFHFHEYRDALYKMLLEENLLKFVVYVSMKDWNGDRVDINQSLFMTDKIHLNRSGYERLDICIASAITRDLQKSKNNILSKDSMSNDTQ